MHTEIISETSGCKPNEFECFHPEDGCIPYEDSCNGWIDCMRDGSDESPEECRPYMRQQPKGMCRIRSNYGTHQFLASECTNIFGHTDIVKY